jgi:hypothetical protein
MFKFELFFLWVLCAPAVSKRGQWSERASIRSRTCTETRGYFSSQLVSISTRSNFSYVGNSRLFAQVNCRSTIATSLKSQLSMIALNKKGQCGSNLPLLFSWLNLNKLKSALSKLGVDYLWQDRPTHVGRLLYAHLGQHHTQLLNSM